jgi:short-subunit dehydrogenase
VTTRSAYNAAKSALNALTANLRMELSATYPKIKVSLVMPGTVLTDFPINALYGAPRPPGSSGMAEAQTAEEVAQIIAALIEHPVAEVYTNPALHGLARQYYEDVGAFEERMAGQQRAR